MLAGNRTGRTPIGSMHTVKKFVHGRSVPAALVAYAVAVRITGAAQTTPAATAPRARTWRRESPPSSLRSLSAGMIAPRL
jgi:hypothetical protein